MFNVIVAFAGDVGVGVSLALTENFVRRGLHRQLGGLPNYEEVIILNKLHTYTLDP